MTTPSYRSHNVPRGKPTSAAESSPWLTTWQVALILHTSEGQVRQYVQDGVLPAFRLAGLRVLRFEASAVEGMLVDAKSLAG